MPGEPILSAEIVETLRAVGAPPRTQVHELTALHQTPSWWGRGVRFSSSRTSHSLSAFSLDFRPFRSHTAAVVGPSGLAQSDHKSTIEIRDTVRGTKGVEGRGMGYPLPIRVMGHKLSQESRSGAPAKTDLVHFEFEMNASDGNEIV